MSLYGGGGGDDDDDDDEASTYKRQVPIPQKNRSLVTLEKVEKS